MRNTFVKEAILFVAVFGVFALPAIVSMQPKAKMVSVQFPKNASRQLASVPVVPDNKDCKTAEKWRYRCDSDGKNCIKDRKEKYLECDKSSVTK